jgi:hypothetical protein
MIKKAAHYGTLMKKASKGYRAGSSERFYPEFILRIPGGEIGSLNIPSLRSSDENNGR